MRKEISIGNAIVGNVIHMNEKEKAINFKPKWERVDKGENKNFYKHLKEKPVKTHTH
jgi:hypothetical protein